MHNNIAFTFDKLKYGQEEPLRKASEFARSMAYLVLVPSIMADIMKSGFDFSLDRTKERLKNVLAYPFAGMFLARDFVSSVTKGFTFGSPPALTGLKEAGYAVKSKTMQKKLLHGAKAVGVLTGRYPVQAVDSVDGLIDILKEETDDWRRLLYSEYALKEPKKKKRKF